MLISLAPFNQYYMKTSDFVSRRMFSPYIFPGYIEQQIMQMYYQTIRGTVCIVDLLVLK